MADLIQSHKGICSLNEENCEISLLVFDTGFFTRLTHSKKVATYLCNLTSFSIAHLTKLKNSFEMPLTAIGI